MELHEMNVALGVNEAERVDTKTLHHAIRPGDRTVTHQPDKHVVDLGGERCEVPEGVVSRLCLWDPAVWFGFERMDEIGKLDCVLDEEHGNVVAHQIVVTLRSVELGGEAADIACNIEGTPLPDGCREPDENLGFLIRILQECRLRDVCLGFVALKVAMGCRTPGVNHPFRNPLVVKMLQLLPKNEILHKHRTA